ncbi:MAG TPA: nicotinate-nucleotide adenylyltransferase [Longimicrobiales bacterium]|nr:nicotinate-nucleotide adenylyltransferase [Longimicrobiales bacterium]
MFGGTFDPPHLGHLIVAQDAHARLDLDRVLFVPAAVPPHKRGRPLSPAPLRLEMVRAAVAADPRFAVDDLELRRAGPSYTVDTLRELRRRDPDTELFLLIGADQFRDFGTWREPQEIARLATLVMLTRAGVSAAAPGLELPHRTLEVTRIDLSATDVRRRVAAGEPIRYLVPDGVEEIIRREALYRASA